METFQILSDQFNHFQHLFHRWLAIFFIISSYIFDLSSSPHTWGIPSTVSPYKLFRRFIPTYVGHTGEQGCAAGSCAVHPHIRGAYVAQYRLYSVMSVHPHIRGAYGYGKPEYVALDGSSPHTWGIHWTAVRKMAGFSHFSYDFIRKSYFVQGLVFFGVIGAEASPTHRRGRNQCLPGAHGGSVRNL